jgi:hypothetical protein
LFSSHRSDAEYGVTGSPLGPRARYEVHCLENVPPESNENIVYEEIEPIPGAFEAKGGP